MHDTGRENLPPVNQTPWAQQLQAGGEEDDACIVTKVTSTDDPLWTMQLSDDDEGGPAEQDCMENGDASSSVVKSEQDCIEIDDPLGSESGERYLRHVQASNFNRSMLPFLKIEESAPWEAAAEERNRLNGLLPFLKIEESAPWEAAARERNRLNGMLPFLKLEDTQHEEQERKSSGAGLNARLPYVQSEETGHGEKERMSSGAAPGKKRKKPEGPAELAQGARNFNFAQRVVLEASFSESNRCPAALDDLVDRLNGLKDAGGKTASAENVRKWFQYRRIRTEASKGPEGPSIAVLKEVKKCVADMIKKLEEEAAAILLLQCFEFMLQDNVPVGQ